MPQVKWDQVNFSRGQLDPRVQVRTDWPNYYKAAKEITNCICIPQGGVTRRWGTEGVTILATPADNYMNVEIYAMSYYEIVYLLVWEAQTLSIYLEGYVVSGIATIYQQADIPNLRFSQVEDRVVITDGYHQPQILKRVDTAPISVTYTINSTIFTANVPTGYVIGTILPVQLGASYTDILPTTSPMIYKGRYYFMRVISSSGLPNVPSSITFQVFGIIEDAVTVMNPYTVVAVPGAGATLSIAIANVWSIQAINFVTLPAYDFRADYFSNNIVFTPSATDANVTPDNLAPVTITLSNPGNTNYPGFYSALVGGVFAGNGGILRIKTVTPPNLISGAVIKAFADAGGITGDTAFIGEPAWSNARGWPKVSSYYQNRMIYGNSVSIPNGQWLSVINNTYDFNDAEIEQADDAISSYPAGGSGGYIQSITSARSLLVHTNKANYSTSIQNESILAPATYMLIEHNKFGVGPLAPVYIDNQLFFVDNSGNNIITMTWDFIQGNYVTNSVSIAASGLIKNPVDMTAFSEPKYLDGFYVLFVNNDGTMCILQTLKEEDILAFSSINTTTSLVAGQNNESTQVPSLYRKVTAAQNRCWFLVERTVLQASNVIMRITGISLPDSSFVVASIIGFLQLNNIYRCTFVPTGNNYVLPVTSPTVTTSSFYFIVPITATKICIYGSLSDAANNTNKYVPSSDAIAIGSNINVQVYLEKQQLFVEEVSFDVNTDMTYQLLGTAGTTTSTVNLSSYMGGYMNGQVVQIVGDGNVLKSQTVFNNSITIEKPSIIINIGLQYTSTLIPLPPVVPENPGMLFNPKHIRTVYISYYNTAGATVQGYGIPTQTLGEVVVVGGAPDIANGLQVFTYAPMEGWSGINVSDLVISQSQPLPMTIVGLSYIIDL